MCRSLLNSFKATFLGFYDCKKNVGYLTKLFKKQRQKKRKLSVRSRLLSNRSNTHYKLCRSFDWSANFVTLWTNLNPLYLYHFHDPWDIGNRTPRVSSIWFRVMIRKVKYLKVELRSKVEKFDTWKWIWIACILIFEIRIFHMYSSSFVTVRYTCVTN